MTKGAERGRTELEVEAREALMREEFERRGDVWENGVPVDDILRKLKAKITDNE
ncbi:MAG TPA: hypothetical protein VHX67_08415 [Acidimicrobiales bacterium]|nr:hypothetical protein [Acidimicrobiales bacterium]